jgi:hypothetical protein
MTIDINFVDAAKLEIFTFDYLWIGWNAGWCNDCSLLVGASSRIANKLRGEWSYHTPIRVVLSTKKLRKFLKIPIVYPTRTEPTRADPSRLLTFMVPSKIPPQGCVCTERRYTRVAFAPCWAVVYTFLPIKVLSIVLRGVISSLPPLLHKKVHNALPLLKGRTYCRHGQST